MSRGPPSAVQARANPSVPSTKPVSDRPNLANTNFVAASQSPAPSSLASEVERPPALPPFGRQTAHTASSQNPTRTHISRPRAKAHAFHHSARDIQERRLVRSRFQSRPGQAREGDSRPGPFEKEHRSKVHSATPTSRSQAHSFYRTVWPPSISVTRMWI